MFFWTAHKWANYKPLSLCYNIATMSFPNIKKIRFFLIAFLALAVLSIGVLSVSLIHYQDCMEGTCATSVCQSSDCAAPSGDLACINHCVSAVLSSAQSFPANSAASLYLLLLTAVLCSALFVLNFNEPNNHRLSKSRLRQFYELSKTSFFLQLGFWICLIEKRDPAYVFE